MVFRSITYLMYIKRLDLRVRDRNRQCDGQIMRIGLTNMQQLCDSANGRQHHGLATKNSGMAKHRAA